MKIYKNEGDLTMYAFFDFNVFACSGGIFLETNNTNKKYLMKHKLIMCLVLGLSFLISKIFLTWSNVNFN